MFPIHDNNPTVRFPALVLLLCAANLLIYYWQSTLTQEETLKLLAMRAFTPNRVTSLWEGEPGTVTLGEEVKVTIPTDPKQATSEEVKRQVYSTAVSSMFMHGNWMHVLGNMWFLWLFGNNIEDRLGHIRFILLYFAGGLAATAAQWYVDPSSTVPCVGASGAVAAVMGAYIVTYPNARVRTVVVLFVLITMVDLPALVVLGFWFGMQLLEGVNALNLDINGGVAWWAHVGGFVAGCVLMFVLKIGVPPPDAHGRRRRFESFEEPRHFRANRGREW